ncbi:MAG: hypothetical protein C0603_12165 [Denitrovibrio sp.]|nr:MAG: hypothetical protein C0603_12165 [Denitrovibrio sp.]
MNNKASSITYLLLLIFILYSGIFSYNYTMNVDLMEARNFVTAREVIQNNDWLIPTMNGEPRIAKPPLPTWLTAISMHYATTDANLTMNRIPAGLSAVLAIIFLFLFVQSFSNNSSIAFYSALVLVTSYMFIYMARKGTWDIFCHTFMLGVLWTFYEGLKSEKHISRWFISSGFLMALSWMSKGPVAFYTLLLPFLLSYVVFYRAKGFKSHWKGILVAFAIGILLSLIWPAYLYFSIPHIASSVAGKEVIAWGKSHVKPFWYYLQFPIMSGLWFLPALALFNIPHSIKKFENKKTLFFLLTWVVLEILLLSIIPEKKDRYLLPVTITMSIPIAYYINNFSLDDSRWSKGLISFYKYFSIAILAISILAICYTSLTTGFSIYPMIILLASAIVAFIIHKNRLNTFIGLALAIALFINGASPLAYSLNKPKDFMELIQVRDIDELKGKKIFSNTDNMKLVWAIGQQIRVLNKKDIVDDGNNIFISRQEGILETLLDPAKYQIEPIDTGLKNFQLYKFRKVQAE